MPLRARHANGPLATVTAVAMAGLALAFGWILLLDLRRYGELPDPSLLPIQVLLIATAVIAATRRRWAPTIAALVALATGIGSAVQPITMLRLTDPEGIGFQVGTALILVFAAVAVVAGLIATARAVRTARTRA